MKRWKIVFCAAVLAGSAIGVSGCGNDENSSPSNAYVVPSSEPGDVSTLTSIALGYLNDLFAAKYHAANQYVAPSSKGVLDAISLSSDQGPSSVSGLKIGDVSVLGNAATVVFMGRICPSVQEKQQCIENMDPSSSDSKFVLNFARLDRKWLLVFSAPSGTTSAITSEAPPNGGGATTDAPSPDPSGNGDVDNGGDSSQ